MKELNFSTHHFLRYIALFFIGFANAVPIPFSSSLLSIWLSEAGLEKSEIGLFALLGLPFSLKILWTPIVDHCSLPFFQTNPRKGWLLFSVLGMVLSLLSLSFVDPSENLGLLMICLVSLSLFMGCLYIIGVAYELESLDDNGYNMGSACVITGYRLGLLAAGGGALYVAALWGWPVTFVSGALLLAMGSAVILTQPEPFRSAGILEQKREQFLRYPSLWQGFWNEVILEPCRAFFQRAEWLVILFLVVAFNIGSLLGKGMDGPFLLSLGFDKAEIALISKTWGFFATILGTFIAGIFFRGRNPALLVGTLGLVHACSLLGHYILSLMDKSYIALYSVVAIENFTGGMAMAAFISFLWKICDKRYAAVQYALLWTVFSLKSDVVVCLGGILAATYSWNHFFLIGAGTGITSALAAWHFAWSRESSGGLIRDVQRSQ